MMAAVARNFGIQSNEICCNCRFDDIAVDRMMLYTQIKGKWMMPI